MIEIEREIKIGDQEVAVPFPCSSLKDPLKVLISEDKSDWHMRIHINPIQK